MTESPKSRVGPPGLDHLVSLALFAILGLVLPGCSSILGIQDPHLLNLDRGPAPHDDAIYCDIERMSEPRRCASAVDLAVGVRFPRAAVALTTGEQSNIALDYSLASLAACQGQPEAVTFEATFPEGEAVCLNAFEGIPPDDVPVGCFERCLDLNGASADNIPDDVAVFCLQHSRPSTNARRSFEGVCTDAGQEIPALNPRRTQEPVAWTNLFGVEASGPDLSWLSRTSSGSSAAGASSLQLITRGDGYVEFKATAIGATRLCGLSYGGDSDTDPSAADLGFGVVLDADGSLAISESGTRVQAPDGGTVWGSYGAGDRFRVSVTERPDGAADVHYSLIAGSTPECPVEACQGTPLRTTGPVSYPFHVDASFVELGGSLGDVRIVRIQ